MYEVLRTRIATGAALTPDLLHQAVSSPQYLEITRNLDTIVFGSGTLLSTCAQKITDNGGPTIQNLYGSTESWPSIQGPGLSDDPRYISLHPYGGYEMRHTSGELFELVIKRNRRLEDFQSVFWSYPGIDEFVTRDLFSRHPQHHGYWRHRGRVDEMIVGNYGLKLLVADLERAIEEHEWVRSVLICNDSCRSPVVILNAATHILPIHGRMEQSFDTIFIAAVWPVIQAASNLCTKNFHLRKDLVLIAREGFVQTAKWSVDRASTLRLLRPDIQRLYKLPGGLKEL